MMSATGCVMIVQRHGWRKKQCSVNGIIYSGSEEDK